MLYIYIDRTARRGLSEYQTLRIPELRGRCSRPLQVSGVRAAVGSHEVEIVMTVQCSAMHEAMHARARSTRHYIQ